ncbi:MAG: TetR family transcriptional regulator C-terminal domain-containing protein [Thermoleophilaceae bacterium]|nr:TetR family transcriptional regulator C-terminal domain-containing protein [Thermoleophilaceae bacterium]
MLFRDTTGVPHIADFHRELQASARSLNVALIRREPEMDVPSDQVELLAEAIRSLTTGLALWWLDHPEVPRETLVAVVTRIVRGLVEP